MFARYIGYLKKKLPAFWSTNFRSCLNERFQFLVVLFGSTYVDIAHGRRRVAEETTSASRARHLVAVIKAKDEQMAPRVPVPLVRFFFPSPPPVQKWETSRVSKKYDNSVGFSAKRINILSSESQNV